MQRAYVYELENDEAMVIFKKDDGVGKLVLEVDVKSQEDAMRYIKELWGHAKDLLEFISDDAILYHRCLYNDGKKSAIGCLFSYFKLVKYGPATMIKY